MKLYREMAASPPKAPVLPMKPFHPDPYRRGDKNIVSIVRAEDRVKGINEAINQLGGITPLTKNLRGKILIKPNCNTDDPYPRDTHHETIRTIADILIKSGVKPTQITVGDMSGRARGLPTRATMENLGITQVAEELGLNVSFFDEEEWVTVHPSRLSIWPKGLKIPKTLYQADRVIFTPILRSHTTATFTCSMKLGVGLIDAEERDWLHNGTSFYEKMMEINLAYQVDLVVADVLKMNTGFKTDPEDEVSPGIITASNNMVASDAVSAALMQRYRTVRVTDKPTTQHRQFQLAKALELGSPHLEKINLKTVNLTEDKSFPDLISYIEKELKQT